MGYVDSDQAGSSAVVHLNQDDDADYIARRFNELSWVACVELNGQDLVVDVASDYIRGKASLCSRIGIALKQFRQESAEALHTALNENGWKDSFSTVVLSDELLSGPRATTPTLDDAPHVCACEHPEALSTLVDMIREVGNSFGPLEVTAVDVTVSYHSCDIGELHIRTLPS